MTATDMKARSPTMDKSGPDKAGRRGAERAPIDPMLKRLDEACITVRARRRQRLAVSIDQTETLYIVRSGQLLITASIPGRRHLVVGLLFPGDIFRSAFAPPLPEISLTSANLAEVGRLRWSAAEALMATDTELDTAIHRRAAAQQARLAMHTAIIGALSGEERAASFLVDLAQRIGSAVPGGIAIDLPLSRSDIAEHLSLNADTLSRIMSRLKSRNVFALAGRGRAIIKDYEALCALTPLAGALQEMTPNPALGALGAAV